MSTIGTRKLVAHLAHRNRFSAIVETYLYLALQDALSGGNMRESLSAVRCFWDRNIEELPPEKVRELRSLCRLVPNRDDRELIGAIVDGLENRSAREYVTRLHGWKSIDLTSWTDNRHPARDLGESAQTSSRVAP